MDGQFSGYASVFGVPDLGRDIVMPGAFAASLARRGASGIRMLWQHDPAEPIGQWLSLREDASGLRVEGRLNLAVQRAREIAALMQAGGVDGLSIGFRTLKATPASGGRRLLAVDLWEVSLVTFPLQPGARVLGRAAIAHRVDRSDVSEIRVRSNQALRSDPTQNLILRCRRAAAASKEISSKRAIPGALLRGC